VFWWKRTACECLARTLRVTRALQEPSAAVTEKIFDFEEQVSV